MKMQKHIVPFTNAVKNDTPKPKKGLQSCHARPSLWTKPTCTKFFQPSLLFVCKARSLTLSRAHQGFFNRVGSCLTNKHYTTLEKLVRHKHSSLLWTFVNYSCKKSCNIEPIQRVDIEWWIGHDLVTGFAFFNQNFSSSKLDRSWHGAATISITTLDLMTLSSN